MIKNNSGKFPDVFGYIAQHERIALQRCVLETSDVVGDAVEIGSLEGLSALLILSVLHGLKTLVCIEFNSVEIVVKNISKHGYSGQSFIIRDDYKNFTSNEREPFSFAFIDHNHTFEDNLAAFYKFWPLVSRGGIFSFHDYENPDFPGGTQAINQIIKTHNLSIYLKAGGFVAFKKP
jgi:predicted O-methyltransferase YrrM